MITESTGTRIAVRDPGTYQAYYALTEVGRNAGDFSLVIRRQMPGGQPTFIPVPNTTVSMTQGQNGFGTATFTLQAGDSLLLRNDNGTGTQPVSLNSSGHVGTSAASLTLNRVA